MKIRHVMLLIGTLLLFVFAAANWQQFTTPVGLDLIIQEYEAPFGLVMLGVLAAFAALFLLSLGGVQTSALKKKLQASREIEKAQQTLIDAEGKRLTRFEDLVRDKFHVLETKLDSLDRKLDHEEDSHDRRQRTGKQSEKKRPAVIGSIPS